MNRPFVFSLCAEKVTISPNKTEIVVDIIVNPEKINYEVLEHAVNSTFNVCCTLVENKRIVHARDTAERLISSLKVVNKKYYDSIEIANQESKKLETFLTESGVGNIEIKYL